MLNSDDLVQLFKAYPGQSTINIHGKCIACKRDLTVKISTTTDGFGINGGILLEKNRQSYVVSCLECMHASSRSC